MKKIVYLLSITFLMLQACSSGDNSSEDNSLLLRKWYLVSYTYQGNTYNSTPCSNGNRDYLEFINPNIANYYHVRSTNDCSFAKEEYTWTKNGNVINFNFHSNISTLTISELSATTLIYVETSSTGSSSISRFSSN
jgi:hypothetical protein